MSVGCIGCREDGTSVHYKANLCNKYFDKIGSTNNNRNLEVVKLGIKAVSILDIRGD